MEERLTQFIDYLGISVRQFEIKNNFTNGLIARFLRKAGGTQADTFVTIGINYPNLNLDWLFTGIGTMLDNSYTLEDKNTEIEMDPKNLHVLEKLAAALFNFSETDKVRANNEKSLIESNSTLIKMQEINQKNNEKVLSLLSEKT